MTVTTDISVNPTPYRQTTEAIGAELAAALVAAQSEFSAVAKDRANPFFKSSYADLPAVKAEAQPVLAKHGLAVIQEPKYVVIEGKIHDTLTTIVVHSSGQIKASTMILKPVKGDPQAQGSAITYAKRYAFMAILGLVADDDDDGNTASGRAKSGGTTRTRARSNAPTGDGIDQEALNAANAELKAAAKDVGMAPKTVIAMFKEVFKDDLQTTRDIEKLKAAAQFVRDGAGQQKNDDGGAGE